MILLSPSFLFFLTLVQFVTSSPTDNGAPLTIPLRRRERPAGTFIDVAKMADNMRTKYGYQPVLDTTLQRRQKVSGVSIQDEGPDVSYFAAIQVGTPHTGSSDLWVASTACQRGCQGSPLYDFQSSSTFKDGGTTVQVQYGSGSVIGELGSETISLGGFTVQNQGFIVAQAVSEGLVDAGSSGLIGLGFQTLAETGATPAVQALAQSNQLASPEMAFFLARNIDNPNVNSVNPGGTFTLGGTNSSLFTGSVQFIDIPNDITPSFWFIPVDAVSIGGNTINVSQQESGAAIDTGTTLIGVPSDILNEVCSQIPNSQNGTGSLAGFCVIPCSSSINSAMTFGGKSWPINPADFSIQQPGNNNQIVCVTAMFDLTPNTGPTPGAPPQKRQNNIPNPAFIVGDAFLKNVYSVFRFSPPSVGFAQLGSNGGGSDSSSTPL
ncbi:hypothetical protein Clacol_000385 [Clathrus columnatus]|uniref:Peptidase A1 domain-containing protein n=1 Tax=Clathrus columnatus TaxID=1419009 RepID=A0AAV4ZWG5_9AGAM|nr:hypothetical protein Clacol_000385 [Clathrus columnatus]